MCVLYRSYKYQSSSVHACLVWDEQRLSEFNIVGFINSIDSSDGWWVCLMVSTTDVPPLSHKCYQFNDLVVHVVCS